MKKDKLFHHALTATLKIIFFHYFIGKFLEQKYNFTVNGFQICFNHMCFLSEYFNMPMPWSTCVISCSIYCANASWKKYLSRLNSNSSFYPQTLERHILRLINSFHFQTNRQTKFLVHSDEYCVGPKIARPLFLKNNR